MHKCLFMYDNVKKTATISSLCIKEFLIKFNENERNHEKLFRVETFENASQNLNCSTINYAL